MLQANALLLDGMVFMGQPLRIARPSDYTPSNASVAVAPTPASTRCP